MNRILSVAFLLLTTLPSPAPAADVVLLSGKSVKCTITTVDPQFLTVKEDGGIITKLNVKEIASVELGGKLLDLKTASFDEIELTDGSILRVQQPTNVDDGQKTLFKAKKVLVAALPGPKDIAAPTADLPLTTLYYLMRSGHDSSAQAAWKTSLARKEKRDSLILKTGDNQQRLLGTVLDGNEAGDRINFEDEKGAKNPYPLARVVGLIFNQPPRDVIPPTICKVIDVFGNTLVATAIDFEGSGAKVTTVSGAIVTYPSAIALARLDFSQSNVTYLTTLTPTVVAPEDLTELFLTYTVDKTRQAKPLQLASKTYPKGLCIFGGVSLTYKLGGDFREFKALVGIDDSIEVANSKVKLSIVADGRTLFTQVIGRKDKPRELALDVKDVKELRIVVEQDEPFYANCVNLCEVRVQK